MFRGRNPISARAEGMIRTMRFRRIAAALVVLLAPIASAVASAGAPGETSTVAETTAEKKTVNDDSGPFVRVLGTAQDGGFPHAACNCERCELARRDPAHSRGVASLALVLPGAPDKVYLIDATPDVRRQIDLLADVRDAPEGRVDRAPVDGVMLTHAHLGHYTGLAFFGFEAVHTSDLPVFCTPAMAEFLRGNGPWSQMVEIGNVDLREVAPGSGFELDGGVRVELLKVPHRDEFADTVGFVLRGPRRSLLYVPDTDSWDAWKRPLPKVLRDIDVAILDGSFYSLDELPGRDISQVKHPLITTSMDLLQETVDAGETEVYFSHMNHTNPVLMPGSAERREIERRGFHVLEDGQEIGL